MQKLNPLPEEKANLEKEKEGKKEEEIPQELKDKIEESINKSQTLKRRKRSLLTDYGRKNKIVRQLIDLALLSNNMLKGRGAGEVR